MSNFNNGSNSSRGAVPIKVKSTGETIYRVMIERSGYRVVRYADRYHIVRGTGQAAPYIIGRFDGEDVLGAS